jgi:hypothetical protein
MPPNMANFLGDHFDLLFALALLWTALWMGYGLWRRSRRGPHFPRVRDVSVVFRDDFVGVRWPKPSSARGCMIVIVTTDELWVTTCFPFTAVAGFYDLERRIPLSTITNVQRDGKWFYLDFTRGDGSPNNIALRIRNGNQFLAALGEAELRT